MVTKDKLKEVILSNQEFILNQVGTIIKREDIHLPERLNKVIVLYGVRRSGKTFGLYGLFRKFKDRGLYIDFETLKGNLFRTQSSSHKRMRNPAKIYFMDVSLTRRVSKEAFNRETHLYSIRI